MSDEPFRIGDWAQWTPYTGSAAIACWYHGKTIPCDEPEASRIVHDRRGCFHVCKAHCDWRSTTSLARGHRHCPDGKT